MTQATTPIPTPAGVTIRPMTSADLGWAHVLNEANVPAVGTETAEEFAHLLDVASVALVAMCEGAPAGFCIVMSAGADYDSVNYLWFAARHDEFLYLDRVAIDERHRRRGIGRALYAEVEAQGLIARPAASVFCLEVNIEPRNDASLDFHHALGFREAGQQSTPYGTRVSLMTRPLA
ncbi:MAG: GNAT family N-acetyltransferase [Ilumatobacteraceae bacterium]